MQKIYLLAIASLCLFSACKKDYLAPEPTQLNVDNPAVPLIGIDGNYYASTAPAYYYNASYTPAASGFLDTLFPMAGVADYAPIIQAKLQAIESHAGGTLYIMPGDYICNSSMGITLYYRGFSNQRLNILGVSDAAGNGPQIYTEAATPHHFFAFYCDPNDDVQEVNIDNIKIKGNNQKLTPSHPFYGAGAQPRAAISFGNVNRSIVSNCVINNVYGDGIQTANWFMVGMSEYNLNEYSKALNVHIIDCWSNNLLNNSGDGIMMYHVGNPTIERCVISNTFNEQQTYGRGGIVMEVGTRDANIRESFIQGYRTAIICEQDLGGHSITKNQFIKNKYSAISFAHDPSMVAATDSRFFHRTSITENIFLQNQNYLEWGANGFGFIGMGDFGHALAGMRIEKNRFMFHEPGMPAEKIWWCDPTLVHPYNVFIQKWGATGIDIGSNSYDYVL